MSEASDLERTEAPSPRRLEKAREEGQVAQSRELATFVVLMVGGGSLWMMGSTLSAGLAQIMRSGMKFDSAFIADPTRALSRLSGQTMDIVIVFAPLLLLLVVAALASPLLLRGWLFSAKAVTPDLKRLNPLSGIKRIVSLHGLVEMVKALGKVGLLGAVAVWLIWSKREAIFSLGMESIPASTQHLGDLISRGFLLIAGAMIFIVLIDVPFQLWNHHKKLMMSKEELRQEAKESEGNPQIKARIRQQQREISRRRMMAEIPHADVVVTNPTHYAVALKYSDGDMRAPRVVAKGADLVAMRIREIAAANGVPTLEAPPLARALHQHTELGDEIPAALYAAVAEVLAYVFQLRNFRTAGGYAPTMPVDLPVPKELDPKQASELDLQQVSV
ncbi:MAG: flagellar biosynthesis protein FlhB [Thiobacillaceae bacterium]